MSHVRWGLILLTLLFAPALAFADSIDFISALGISGTDPMNPYFFGSYSVDVPGGLTVTAWAWSGSSWQHSQLTARNDDGSDISDHDHGLGVCSATIIAVKGKLQCGSDTNPPKELPDYLGELDNIKNFELLQVSRSDGSSGAWTGIDLSSVDKNGGLNQYATGQVFAGDGDPLTALSPSNFATLLCTFNYDNASPYPPQNPPQGPLSNPIGCAQHPVSSFAFDASLSFLDSHGTAAVVTSKYLYLWAYDPNLTDPQGGNPPFGDPPFNDFLLKGVEFQAPVPEPSAVLLFATGLAGIGAGIRRFLR